MLILPKLTGIIFLLVFIILSPSYAVLPGGMGYFDNQRMMEFLIVCDILVWVVLQQNSTILSQKQAFTLPLSLLVLLVCVSAFLSLSPQHALLETSLFAGLFYLSLFTANLWKQYRCLLVKVLAYAILLGAVVYIIGFIAGYLASFIEHIPLRWPEPFHGFTNLRFFNQYQLWTLSLLSLPLLAFNLDDTHFRFWIFPVISCWWMMLFASAGRGVLLSLLFAMIATIVFYRTIAWPFLRIQLLALIAGLSIHTLLFRVIPFFMLDPLYSGSVLTGSVLRFTTQDRLTLWQQALTMAREHPFFGVGPMHYAWYPNTIAAHPHNSVLQLAAEWGLPATLLVLLITGYGVYCWLKTFNTITLNKIPEIDRHLPVVLFFALTTCACYSLVDGVIVMPMSQVMMAVVVGLMLGVYSDTQRQQSEEMATNNFLAYRVFAGLVLTTLLWSVWPDALPRLTGNSQMITPNLEVEGPRFWQEGGIPH